MKDIREIYQALIDDKTLINKYGCKVTIDNVDFPNFSNPENWEIYDEFADLKKAHAEGAEIEEWYCTSEEWWINKEPEWRTGFKYRIRNDISLESWEAHKDLIKAWWNGAEIEFRAYNGSWKETDSLYWWANVEYRIKPSECEIEPAKWKTVEELLKSIDEYATTTFEVERCGTDYYKCNMCEAKIKDSRKLDHLYGRTILNKITHNDDCPYILGKKVREICDEPNKEELTL